MTFLYKDRVQETTLTTGTGSYALSGAVVGFQSFAAIGDGNTCYYAVTDGLNWEVGLGTYTANGRTLARTTILASSNADTAVHWGLGTKNIWLDFPAVAATETIQQARIITAGSPVTVGVTDTDILLNLVSAAATTINLPAVASRNGLALRIADIADNAGPIIIAPSGSEKIMGLSASIELLSNGAGSLGLGASITLWPNASLGGWYTV